MSEYSLFSNYRNSRVRCSGADAAAFLRSFAERPLRTRKKEETLSITLATFRRGRRCLKNVDRVTGLSFDIDGPGTEDVIARLRGDNILAIGHSTMSHVPGEPRGRVYVFFDRGVTAEESRPLRHWLIERFEIPADPSAADPCRVNVLPCVPHADFDFRWFDTKGMPLDIGDALARISTEHGKGIGFHRRAADADRSAGHRSARAHPSRRGRGDRDGRRLARRVQKKRIAKSQSAQSRAAETPRKALSASRGPNVARIVGELFALNADDAFVGQRNGLAMELGAAIVEAGVPARSVRAIIEPTLISAREYASAYAIALDLDMDGAGREIESWLIRAERSAAKTEDGDEVRGLGSLAHRRNGLVRAIRDCVQDLLLAGAERPVLGADDASRAMADALDSNAPIIALNISTGGGKSRVGRAWVVAGGGRAYVSTPTHALKAQMKAKLLAETGVEMRARAPSLLALRRPDGSLICSEPERVELAMYAGDRPTSACSGCPHRATCAPAIEAALGDDKRGKRAGSRVVLTHAGAARELNAIVAAGEAPGSRFFFDECPSLARHGRWSAFEIDKYVERHLTPRGAAIFTAVTAVERDEDVGEAARAAASARGPLIRRGAPKGSRPFVRALSSLAEAIACGVEKSFMLVTHLKNGRPSLRWRSPAPWVRAVREYVAAGGRVLIADATLDAAGISAALGIEVQTIHVADAPGTRRVFVRDDGVATPRRSGDAVFGRIVRDARLALGERRPSSIGLVTWKEWKDAAAEALREAFPGAEISALHYGGERGLDDLEDCEVLITAGDPWVNASAIGADPTTREGKRAWEDELQRWLVQAHGRARSARRAGKTIVHVGGSAPDPRIAPQWAGCEIVRPGQRAVSVVVCSLSALGLSVRELARVLGCSPSTAYRRLRAELFGQKQARIEGWNTSVKEREIVCSTPLANEEPSVDPGERVLPPEERATLRDPMRETNDPSEEEQKAPAPAEMPVVEEYEAALRRLITEEVEGRGEANIAMDLREQLGVLWYALSEDEQDEMVDLRRELIPPPREANDGPDPFDGAGAKPRRYPDPIEHPFPTTDLIGKCPLPQPPRLKKTQAPAKRVELLLKAFRAVYACRFPNSPMKHLYKNVRDLEKSKLYPPLLAAADAMLADDIPPHIWIDWSIEQFYAQKAAPPRDPKGQGPPWMWILSIKRIAKQGNWFRATACSASGMALLSQEAEDVLARYRVAVARMQSEEEEDVFYELFPLGYLEECDGAKDETEHMLSILKRLRDSWNVHLWARYEKEIRRILAPELARESWG